MRIIKSFTKFNESVEMPKFAIKSIHAYRDGGTLGIDTQIKNERGFSVPSQSYYAHKRNYTIHTDISTTEDTLVDPSLKEYILDKIEDFCNYSDDIDSVENGQSILQKNGRDESSIKSDFIVKSIDVYRDGRTIGIDTRIKGSNGSLKPGPDYYFDRNNGTIHTDKSMTDENLVDDVLLNKILDEVEKYNDFYGDMSVKSILQKTGRL